MVLLSVVAVLALPNLPYAKSVTVVRGTSCTGTNTPVTFVIELWSIGLDCRGVGAFSSRVGEGRLGCG